MLTSVCRQWGVIGGLKFGKCQDMNCVLGKLIGCAVWIGKWPKNCINSAFFPVLILSVDVQYNVFIVISK